MDLKKKNVLITGGTRGIGKACALLFAQEGANIIMNYANDHDVAKQTLEEIESYHVKAAIIQADISSPEQVDEMFKVIDESFNSIDVLINNGGWTKYVPHDRLDMLSSELFSEIVDMHLKGTYLCSKEAISRMNSYDTNSVVINIASSAAYTAIGSNIAYCAAKAGVVNMTKSMARAFGPKVRVNCIAPGLTETTMTKKGPQEYIQQNIKMTPLQRIAGPFDISSLALCLVKDMVFVTGQTIVVDGGKTLKF